MVACLVGGAVNTTLRTPHLFRLTLPVWWLVWLVGRSGLEDRYSEAVEAWARIEEEDSRDWDTAAILRHE